MTPVVVSLVEDNAALADELRELFNSREDLAVLDVYPDAESALLKLPKRTPDLLVVDLRLPGMNGVDLIATLKQVLPAVQILVLTMYEETDLIFDALKAGACGYLLKRSRPEEICDAIHQVTRGGSPMSPSIARKVVESFRSPAAEPGEALARLSPREEEVLGLLAEGALYKEIAAQLDISLDTVRTHIRRIYEKLHVRSRTQAIVKFFGKPR